MRKVLSLFLTFIIILPTFMICVSGVGTHTVECGHIADIKGRIVALPVVYSGDDGFYTMKVDIDYDTALLKYVKTEKSSDKMGYTINEKGGVITVLTDASGINNLTGEIEICKVYFEIQKTDKTGKTDIKLSGDASRVVKSDNGISVESVDLAFKNGSVNIICSEHNFTIDTENGKKCDKCDAVQVKDTEIVVPVITDKKEKPLLIKPGKAVKSEEQEDGFKITPTVIIITVVSVFALAAIILLLLKLKKIIKSKKEAR